MGASNRKYFITNLDFNNAFNLAGSTLMTMGANIKESYPQMGRLTAKIGTGVRSWGENLTVTIFTRQGSCQVEVLSQCALPTQIVDWGKNSENTAKFEQMFRMLEYAELQQAGAQASPQPPEAGEELFCPNCGAPVPAGANFCPKDGTRVR